MRGRDYVLPQDVVDVGRDVLPHRLVLAFDAVADGIDQQQVVQSILRNVPQPRPVWRHGAPDGPDGPGGPGAAAGPAGSAGPSGPQAAPPGAPEFT